MLHCLPVNRNNNNEYSNSTKMLTMIFSREIAELIKKTIVYRAIQVYRYNLQKGDHIELHLNKDIRFHNLRPIFQVDKLNYNYVCCHKLLISYMIFDDRSPIFSLNIHVTLKLRVTRYIQVTV